MVVYGQQSIDMSLYTAAVLLANKGTAEKEAVREYNHGRNPKEYVDKTEYRLKCLGTDFMS